MRTNTLLAVMLAASTASPALAAPAPAHETRSDLEARINIGPLAKTVFKNFLGGAGIAGLTSLLSGGSNDDGSGKRAVLTPETISFLSQLDGTTENDIHARGIAQLFTKIGPALLKTILGGAASGAGAAALGAAVGGGDKQDEPKRAIADTDLMNMLQQAAEVDKRDPNFLTDLLKKFIGKRTHIGLESEDLFDLSTPTDLSSLSERDVQARGRLAELFQKLGEPQFLVGVGASETPVKAAASAGNQREASKRAAGDALMNILQQAAEINKRDPNFFTDLLKKFIGKRASIGFEPEDLFGDFDSTDIQARGIGSLFGKLGPSLLNILKTAVIGGAASGAGAAAVDAVAGSGNKDEPAGKRASDNVDVLLNDILNRHGLGADKREPIIITPFPHIPSEVADLFKDIQVPTLDQARRGLSLNDLD